MDLDNELQRAVALHQAGRCAEAGQVYEALLKARPDHADATHLLGVVRLQTGASADGLRLVMRAVGLNPAAASYRGNLAKALQRTDVADWAAALSEAADFLADFGNRARAVAFYHAALATGPDTLAGWFNLGVSLRDSGRYDEALIAFRRAGRLRPDVAPIDGEIAPLAFRQGDYAAAAAGFTRLVRAAPDDVAARLGLAHAVKALGESARAATLYRQALALQPGEGAVWFNLGVALGDRDQGVAAIAAYRRAVVAAPDHVNAHYNLAHQLLLAGQFAEGWREFEWRFRRGVDIPDRGRPRWNGEAAAGRTILLYGEQGHGDTVQFIRYAPLVAATGARVVVECPPALLRLAATVPGVAAVHPLGKAPDFDLICPLLSLPLIFGTTTDSVPAAIPYIADRFDGDERFDRYFDDDDRRRVGLVWAGGPHRNDARWSFADTRRSIPLAGFAPLLAAPGVRFYSLQAGEAAAQAKTPPFADRMVDPMSEVGDFADTAGIIRRLDLIISVDTAVAHVAGALGKPVWLLSRYDGCWRWLAGRDDSPWYPPTATTPGMRVFRQPQLDDWQPVLARLADEFVAWAATPPRGRPA